MDGSGFETSNAPVNDTGALSFDLNIVIATFRRRFRLFAAVAVVVFAAVVLFTLQQTPKYTATAQVMLDVRKEQVTDMNAVLSGLPADSSVVDTEVEVLKSRSLASRVVKDLKLEQDPYFNPYLPDAKGATAWLSSLKKAAAPTATTDPLELQRQRERIVDNVLGGLKVRRAGLTYLISIEYTHKDPKRAADLANAFANLYLTEQLEAKFDATAKANEWLDTRVAELRDQVQQADAAVQQYKIANNLLSAEGATLTEQEISGLNQQLALSRASQAETDARLSIARQQLARGSTGEDVGESLNSPVVQQLRSQRAAKSAQVADLAGRYGDRHPDLLKARRELADIDGQIQAEIRRIISSLEAQAQVARQRTGSVAASVSQSKGTLAGNNRAAIGLAELERKSQSVKTLYETLLARFKQTTTQDGIEQADARVVSPAKIPTGPSYPKPSLNFALGLVLALGAGVAAVVLAEILMAGLFTEDEVERRLGLPYLEPRHHGRRRQDPEGPDAAGLSVGQAAFQLRRKPAQAACVDPVLQGWRDGEGHRGHLVPAGRRQDHDHLLAGAHPGQLGRQGRGRRLRPAPERHQPVPEGAGSGRPAGGAERRGHPGPGADRRRERRSDPAAGQVGLYAA
jgi:uncharacterized protein involved in exopolysaccharide biosynthesis